MEELEQKSKETLDERLELPLVVEILVGQQEGNGLNCIFQPEEYLKKDIHQLLEEGLKRDYSIEDKEKVMEIEKALKGEDGKKGKIFYGTKEVDDPLKYAKIEKTILGEDFLYLPIKIISPKEGGKC